MDFALIAQVGEPFFPEQVTTDQLAQNLVYLTGTVGALIILAGLVLLDVGGVRRVNIFDNAIQKLIGFFIGFVVYYLIGYAIWNWQYYVAFDVPNPYWQSIEDWFLGGNLTNEFAQSVDPAVAPGLNTFQIFLFFLAAFAGIINVLIHIATTERIKPAAFYIVCVFATIMSSVLSWLTFGSVSAITNLGYHDFFGAGFFYVFTGVVGGYLAWRVGRRPGMFSPHPRVPEYRSSNLGLTTVGVLLVFAGVPMVVLSCGFFFAQDGGQQLFISITMAESGVGVAVNNYAMAWAGGALGGALIAYKTKKYIYTLLGPFGGYVAGTAGFDIYWPWQMFLVALGAPFVAFVIYEWLHRREIDEHKLIPLLFGCGTYGLIMVGAVKWGTAQSGYFGVETGTYAFQNAEVKIYWQFIGIALVIGGGLLTAAILAFILERTIGLRVSEEVQVEGFDLHYWQVEHESSPFPNGGPPAEPTPARTGAGEGFTSREEGFTSRESGQEPYPGGGSGSST